MFDNTNTDWTDVYLYSWGMGYFGDFVKMDAAGNDLYTAVAPVDVEAVTYTLFYCSKDSCNS